MELYCTSSHESTQGMGCEPVSEEHSSSQDDYPEGTRVVLLGSDFSQRTRNPYLEDERRKSGGPIGVGGARVREGPRLGP